MKRLLGPKITVKEVLKLLSLLPDFFRLQGEGHVQFQALYLDFFLRLSANFILGEKVSPMIIKTHMTRNNYIFCAVGHIHIDKMG